MPPRAFTNPAPKTESAREARKSFFCELCQKGYSRMNEYEAHESSYDHQHKKRLKDMKQMQKDPMATTKARKAEKKADEKSGLISIKPVKLGGAGSSGPAGGFKKGGFKSAFGKVDLDDEDTGSNEAEAAGETPAKSAGPKVKQAFGGADERSPGIFVETEEESDTGDEGYEVYDPRHPTE